MVMEYTQAQKNRLLELGAQKEEIRFTFSNVEDRERTFKIIEKESVGTNKARLTQLMDQNHQPKLSKLQQNLITCLCNQGFTQVMTPIMITRKSLEKMSIGEGHPLLEQVFWVDHKTCLRPMLAPNLYDVSAKLMNISKLPLRIFEIGSCFRKESEGNSHLKEFTMLNLVEWGTPMNERNDRLKELAKIVLEAAEIDEYCLEEEDSTVYGKGLDVVGTNGIELASTSMGPHKLDAAWKIASTWVGIGFGLERLLMVREKEQGIHRFSKSNTFLDGACLKLK